MAPGCETARPILERTRAARVSSSASPLLKTEPACAANPRTRLVRSRETEPAVAPVLLIAWAALSLSLARRHAPRSGSNRYINPAPAPRLAQAVIPRLLPALGRLCPNSLEPTFESIAAPNRLNPIFIALLRTAGMAPMRPSPHSNRLIAIQFLISFFRDLPGLRLNIPVLSIHVFSFR